MFMYFWASLQVQMCVCASIWMSVRVHRFVWMYSHAYNRYKYV